MRTEKSQSVDFTAYFMVLQTKTYASYLSVSPKSISNEKSGKKAIISPQDRFFGRRNNLSLQISFQQVANTRIWLLTIHSLGITSVGMTAKFCLLEWQDHFLLVKSLYVQIVFHEFTTAPHWFSVFRCFFSMYVCESYFTSNWNSLMEFKPSPFFARRDGWQGVLICGLRRRKIAIFTNISWRWKKEGKHFLVRRATIGRNTI